MLQRCQNPVPATSYNTAIRQAARVIYTRQILKLEPTADFSELNRLEATSKMY